MYNKDYNKYIVSLAKARIVPWDYDVSRRVIINTFGIKVVFTGNIKEISLDDWINLVFHEDRDGLINKFNSVINGESDDFEIDYRVSICTGSCMWLRTMGRVVEKDKDGKPLLITGTNQDVSELRILHDKSVRRERKLSESDSRLRNAMKLGRMSPWEYDFESETFISDRQMSEIWGYGDRYEENKPISRGMLAERIHPEEKDYVLQKFADAINKGDSIDISYRIIADGEVKHIHFVSEVQYNEQNIPVKLIGVAQDITGIKKLEMSLARHLEGLSYIADRIGLGLWEMDAARGRITFLNYRENMKEDSRYRGLKLDDIMERVHPEDIQEFEKKVSDHLAGKESVIEADLRIDGNGQYKWYHISSVINKSDQEGKPVTLRGFYQDITERKDIEGRLYQSQKMEAIGRLAGGVAHDFNNILQVILGYGSLALMEADNDSELFQNISNIVDSADKARSLVKQLLLFARKEKFTPSLVSVNDLIKGLLAMLRRLISENINLSFIPDDNIMKIHGDPGQLEQVFMNLCLNARDAINGSGTIIIRTVNIALDENWPCFDNQIPPGNYVQISISDTGSGMDSAVVNHIFEPFYTTKEKDRGTGLGLATVYSIIKQHDGFIDVYSLKGKGSTFTVYFPVSKTEDAVKSAEENYINVRKIGIKKTIMLAEDDELVRKYTSRILSDSGYNVILAEDGEAAVMLYSENKENIDLIILDVVMPKINGWDVYNTIGGEDLKTPVIFFSGYDRDLLPDGLMLKPDIRFVQKPFKYYAIIKAVHELLD